MEASPIVDWPAPDSPIRPSTSPRFSVSETPLTISNQLSPSLCPSIRRSSILRSGVIASGPPSQQAGAVELRSEEHTSELQSLMRISYAVFCLKKKTRHLKHTSHHSITMKHTCLTQHNQEDTNTT